MVGGGLPAFHCFHCLSSQILVYQWFAADCCGLSYSHTACGGSSPGFGWGWGSDNRIFEGEVGSGWNYVDVGRHVIV